ncbi:hypothetical protein CHL67_00995 [Prosthecochloris sp. GSB1]|nr:hypothetical protein CHL67_00995 [Prosthecochloris sp. GSB1]
MVIRNIQYLPDDATWEDIRERIDFISGFEKGFVNSMKAKALFTNRSRKGSRNGFQADMVFFSKIRPQGYQWKNCPISLNPGVSCLSSKSRLFVK